MFRQLNDVEHMRKMTTPVIRSPAAAVKWGSARGNTTHASKSSARMAHSLTRHRHREDDCNYNTPNTGCTRIMRSMTASIQRMLHTCVHPATTDQYTNAHTPPSPVSSTLAHRGMISPDLKVTKLQEDDIKVKNIYRKPMSRTDNRPRSRSYSPRRILTPNQRSRANTYSWCKTQVTHITSSRSLPINYTNTNGTGGQCMDTTGAYRRMNNSDNREEQQDITKNKLQSRSIDDVPLLGLKEQPTSFLTLELRERASTMPEFPLSIFKQRDPELEIISRRKKHVCCKQKMDGSYVSQIEQHNIDNGLHKLSSIPLSPGRYVPGNDSVCTIEGKVIRTIDAQGNKCQHLLLTVETKGNFIREKTSVKCLSSGTALIVHLMPELSAIPITKRLPLPLTINPYRVKASIGADGILVIRSPIVNI